MSIKEKKTVLAILVFFNLLYFFSSGYITNSNDGSHFALVSSLVENGTVDIWEFFEYTRNTDFARKDGKVYSDRVPGLAFLSIPFYGIGRTTESLGIASYLSDYRNIKEVFVHFLPQLSGTLAVYLMLKLFMLLGFDFKVASLSAFGFGIGTALWNESSHFYSHGVSLTVTLWAVVMLLQLEFTFEDRRRVYLAAALFGLASIVEIQNVLFLGPAGLYLLMSGKVQWADFKKSDFWKLLTKALAVFGAVYILLIYYNYRAFREITIRSNTYNPIFPSEKSVFSSLSGNVLEGLEDLLIGHRTECVYDLMACVLGETPGILVVSPVLILSILFIPRFIRERRGVAVLFLLIFFIELVISATHKMSHSRTMTTVLPYLYVPVVYFVARGVQNLTAESGVRRYWMLAVYVMLILYGAVREYLAINLYFGRSLADPFPFVREIPSFLYFYSVAGLSLLILYFVWKKYRDRHRSSAAV